MRRAAWFLLVGLGVFAACSGGEPAGTGDGGVSGCVRDADCGKGDECHALVCEAGTCIVKNAPEGTPVFAGLVVGDCQRLACGADGAVQTIEDPTDIPDDHNPCTTDTCDGGKPMNVADATKNGTACSMLAPKVVCMDGACVGCQKAEQCPKGGPCDRPVCTLAGGSQGTCGFQVDAMKVVSNVDKTDCFQVMCDAKGELSTVAAPDDIPPPDDNDCTKEVCGPGGVVGHEPIADGTLCGGSNFCAARRCTAGMCGSQVIAMAGAVPDMQVQGDCKVEVCDGSGGTTTMPDDADIAADGNTNDCVKPGCSGGAPSIVNEPQGKACTGGSTNQCDGAGNCL
jgi:hypothetical protein